MGRFDWAGVGMTWVRLDDRHDLHAKVMPLSDLAYRLWVTGMAWCQRSSPDGSIRSNLIGFVLPGRSAGKLTRAVNELEAAGLWEKTETGWRYHDWDEYIPRRSNQTSEERKASAVKAAKARWSDSKQDALSASDAHQERMRNAHETACASDAHAMRPCDADVCPPDPGSRIPIPDPEIDARSAVPVSGTVQLTLAPEPASKAKPKTRKEPTSPHPVIVAHYSKEFERLRSTKPPIGEREGKSIKILLAALGGNVELAKSVITRGLSATWGNPQSINTIANDPAKWLSRAPKLTPGSPQNVIPLEEKRPPTAAEMLAEIQASERAREAVRK